MAIVRVFVLLFVGSVSLSSERFVSVANGDVRLAEVITVPAVSSKVFQKTFALDEGGTLSVSQTINNGRGQPFEIVNYMVGDWSTTPPTFSVSTMRLETETAVPHLLGLGLASVTVSDIKVTVNDLKGQAGTEMFFPEIQLGELSTALDQTDVDQIMADLSLLLVNGGGRFRFFVTTIPEPTSIAIGVVGLIPTVLCSRRLRRNGPESI